jgi:hypothetical protein
MTVVVGTAFRRALAGLVFCFGLFVPLFIGLERMQEASCASEPHFPEGFSGCTFPRSHWDIPIAVGVVAVSVLVAALIYPRRPHAEAPI